MKRNKSKNNFEKLLLSLNVVLSFCLLLGAFTQKTNSDFLLWRLNIFNFKVPVLLLLNVLITIFWLLRLRIYFLISSVSIAIFIFFLTTVSEQKLDLLQGGNSPVKTQNRLNKPLLKNRTKDGLLSFFKTLIRDSLVIAGQQAGDPNNLDKMFDLFITGIQRHTNKYPALIGLDYGMTADNNLSTTNKFAIDQWKHGGLITISWHADNPWINGYQTKTNSIVFKNQINLKRLIKSAPESPEKKTYRRELKKVGQGLLELQKAGITVIWRPLHEMNGSWFWWGANASPQATNGNDFVALWIDMFEYFTEDLKLDNLIWVYSPSSSFSSEAISVLSQFPGSKYVDVVGIDTYYKEPEFTDYFTLKKLNKPMVICEIGPSANYYGTFDETDIISAFKGKAAYFLQWSSPNSVKKIAIIDNLRYKEMFNGPSTITLDDLRYYGKNY